MYLMRKREKEKIHEMIYSFFSLALAVAFVMLLSSHQVSISIGSVLKDIHAREVLLIKYNSFISRKHITHTVSQSVGKSFCRQYIVRGIIFGVALGGREEKGDGEIE